MILSIKDYVISIVIKFKTKINVDTDFYENENFYLIDLEG